MQTGIECALKTSLEIRHALFHLNAFLLAIRFVDAGHTIIFIPRIKRCIMFHQKTSKNEFISHKSNVNIFSREFWYCLNYKKNQMQRLTQLMSSSYYYHNYLGLFSSLKDLAIF